MPEPSTALPIALFNEGFDVWLDGNRGTIYQRGHKSLDNTSAEYWDFGIIEQGSEDQVAQINYIIDTTG
jgi:hypothetical protein